MDEVAEYVQDLCTLVTEVVKEKMSGNIHRDYNNVLDVLREHIHQLQIMRRMLERDDAEGLKNAMERANTIQRIIH